jgi:hypothetical protein
MSARHMGLDGVRGDVELRGDFLVGAARREECAIDRYLLPHRLDF